MHRDPRAPRGPLDDQLPVVGLRVYPGTALHARAVTEGFIREECDLLDPCHYVAPGLTAEFIFDRLADFVRTDTHWIVAEPPASFPQLVRRLRRQGVVGPLWTYFALLQRLGTPPGATTTLGGSR